MNRDPELLRKAAQTLDSARDADVRATEAETSAARLRAEADALHAAARSMYADAHGVGVGANSNISADTFDGRTQLSAAGGGARGPKGPGPSASAWAVWNNGSPTWVAWVALAIAIIALLLGFWLWGLRGDPDATAKREAQAAVKPVADKLDRVEKQVNTNTSGISEAKADAANAVTTANEAKAAAAACTDKCKPQATTSTKRKRQTGGATVPRDREVAWREAPPKTPIVVTTVAECAWIHPKTSYDQSPTKLAGKRFDKPLNYNGNCKQFVDAIATEHGFPSTRKIRD